MNNMFFKIEQAYRHGIQLGSMDKDAPVMINIVKNLFIKEFGEQAAQDYFSSRKKWFTVQKDDFSIKNQLKNLMELNKMLSDYVIVGKKALRIKEMCYFYRLQLNSALLKNEADKLFFTDFS